ncbi:MAG: nucleotidyltransferase domain-containing protein [Parcubacteria group bacterium]|nr:nucleotidyltransferase domain-containing protein [Parcubacteria group bacterium]
MSMAIVDPAQKALVVSTIRKLFPDARILAFGSRINGTPRRYSDLDIAIDCGAPAELSKWSEIEEIFAESDLPFKVDLSDCQRVSREFQDLIRKTGEQW